MGAQLLAGNLFYDSPSGRTLLTLLFFNINPLLVVFVLVKILAH